MKFDVHRRLMFLLPLFLCHAATADVSAVNLPDIGDSAGVFLSPYEEKKLGKEFMRSVRRQARLVNDPDTNAYIKGLGQRLASSSDSPGYGFTFFIVDNASINAFAGPGGYIGIHTGLISTARNESELAGVMAHEIAHVTQRHLVRAYEASSRLSLPTTAGMIAAVLLGVATNAEAGIAAASAIQAGSLQYQINFTRTNEKEADRIGIQTLSNAGIDPFGMPDFFERLQRSTRLYGQGLPEFLSTHPVTTNRIAESKERAEQLGHDGKRNSMSFQLIQARLDVLSSHNPQQTLKRYESVVKENPSSAPALYGMALALEKSGQPERAREILQKLNRQDQDRILFRTALAQLDIDNGRVTQGLDLLSATLKLYPGDLGVSAHYAKALLQAGHADKSRQVLLDLLQNDQTQIPMVYALLAKAADASGRVWEARQASAEIYYLNGQTRAAIGQLEQALATKELAYYDRSKIEARLVEFKQMVQDEEP